MLGDPRGGSKTWEALDREIGKPGENCGQILAHWEFQSSAAFHHRENRRNLRSRLWTADVYPVLPAQGHGTHGIFCKVIAQLKFRIFQESRKFPPQRERVLAGLAECTGGQCNGLCYLDLAADIVQERLGSFLTQGMTPSETNYSAASFRIDGKQFVHPRHNRSCNRVSWVSCTASKNCLRA